jgi:pimeloyl-ACP methyl ester carboxylesterase
MPTLFILHGWTIAAGSQAKWEPFLASLKNNLQRPITLVFLPLPGLSHPLNEEWHLDDYVQWLDDQIQKHLIHNHQIQNHHIRDPRAKLTDDEQIFLLGHSFGGQISIRFAATHPDLISKLILIDASGMRDRRWWARLKRALFWTIAKVGKVFFQQAGLRRLLYKLAGEQDYQQASPMLRQTMKNVLNEEIVNDLPNLQVPTLLVWGEKDTQTPLRHGRYYAQLITRSKLVVIPEARHSPHFTHVGATAKAVSEFCDDSSYN